MAAGSADRPVSERSFHPGSLHLSTLLHIAFVKTTEAFSNTTFLRSHLLS